MNIKKFKLIENVQRFAFLFILILYPLSAQHIEKITPNSINPGAGFGSSVAISSNYAIAGAEFNNSLGDQAGAAYSFKWDGSNWIEKSKLCADDGTELDWFGRAVAISGEYAIIGAPGKNSGTGAIYIFHNTGTNWEQQTKLVGQDCPELSWFGESVDIWGNYAIIGAPGDTVNDQRTGSAYIFHRDGASWQLQKKIFANNGSENDNFGISVAINNDYAIIGADCDSDNGEYSGSVYIFQNIGSNWEQQSKIVSSDTAAFDGFGCSVAISDNRVIIGAYGNNDSNKSGAAYIYSMAGAAWQMEQKLTAQNDPGGDMFGRSVSIFGDFAIIGAGTDSEIYEAAGSAYLFYDNGESWSQRAKMIDKNGSEAAALGSSVALAENQLMLGAPHNIFGNSQAAGLAYICRGIDGLSGDISLPVELSTFTAEMNNSKVILKWTTASEVNNLGFNIYKSVGNKNNFYKINSDLIPGSGNSTTKQKYIFTDTKVIPGQKYYYQIEDVSHQGNSQKHDIIEIITKEQNHENIAEYFKLYPAHPNPFNPATMIKFFVPKDSKVSLTIYDINGKFVKTLTNRQYAKGHYQELWKARDYSNQKVSAGVYIYQLTTDKGFAESGKIIYVN